MLYSVFSMATLPKHKINQIGLYELKIKMSEEKKDSKNVLERKTLCLPMVLYNWVLVSYQPSFSCNRFWILFSKKESKLFNKCVAEIIEDGGTNSEAVGIAMGAIKISQIN